MSTITSTIKAVALLAMAEHLSPGILRQVGDARAATKAAPGISGTPDSVSVWGAVGQPERRGWVVATKAGAMAMAKGLGITRTELEHRMRGGFFGHQRATVVEVDVICWKSASALAMLLLVFVGMGGAVLWACLS